MAFVMDARGAVTLLLVAAVHSIEVNVTGEWRPELGWEVTCEWETLLNDTLQSVRLYNNGQQFLIYRPEKHGPSRSALFGALDKKMTVECTTTLERGRKGSCKLLLEPYQPPVEDFTYTCEVSGERPMFRIGKKDYHVRVLVPPSDALMVATSSQEESSPMRVMLNCSSSGLPAPTIQWAVSENKVQADFTGRSWNATSKLWHVWSYFSYTRTSDVKVTCSPEVNSNNELIVGRSAEYNSAYRIFGTRLSVLSLLVVFYLRR